MREKKIVDDVIGELSAFSLGEMMDALSTLDETTPPIQIRKKGSSERRLFKKARAKKDQEETPSPSSSLENEVVSLDDVYSLGQDIDDFLLEGPPSNGDAIESAIELSDVEAQNEFSSSSLEEQEIEEPGQELPDQEFQVVDKNEEEDISPISGVVRDEIVLFLLQSELVSMSQVFDAIREREEGTDLWRTLAEHSELDKQEIYAAVASNHGYEFQSYLDAPPSKSFVSDVLEIMSGPDLARLISAGLLPVSMDLNVETTQYVLVALSSDPLNKHAQAALLSCPVPITCRFSGSPVIEESLIEVTAWLSELGIEIDVEFPATELEQVNSANDLSDYEVVSADQENNENAALEFEEPLEESRKIRNRRNRATRKEKGATDRVVKQLLAEGIVDASKIAEATSEWEDQGGSLALWRIVADLPGVSREVVYETAARVYAFKHEVIGPGRPDHDFVRLTMETLAEEHHEEMLEMLLVPFEHSIDFDTGTGRIIFVTPDPTRPEVNRLVHELDLGRFELRYASETEILKLYDELFPRKNEYLERISDEVDPFDLGMSYESAEDVIDEDALEAEISRSKLINLFEASLVEAVRQGVSDIHLFPNPNRQVEIHFRLDGRLKKWHTEDKVHPEAFLAVVKDNSTNVDRFERDAAQDGFIQRDIDGALIRFRVSILPIASANQELRAESIVIRILDDRKVLTDITKLGMLDVALDRFNKAIRQPHGMVIVTGPTGSGKSTTLVAALYQVVTPEVNVLTVEDPVEYIIKGVRQIKLSTKLDLEGALRAILRHDPDIVMVGEMRDKYTAELAIKLANTGHLTFSTLHTNDAPAAVSRLYKMGVEPFLIAYAINLVVAQRLIREVCSECKKVDENPDKVMMKSLGWSDEEIASTTIYEANRGSNCPNCGGNGYKGRRAVCEALYFSGEIRTMIAESAEAIDEDAIRDQALKDGMLTLADSARELVKMGATTLEEMLRMTASH